MPCTQKKTAEVIVDSGNNYVLQIKRNQPKLHDAMTGSILYNQPLDSCFEEEKDHGRHSRWYVDVYNAIDEPLAQQWSDLHRFIHVHTWVTKKGVEHHGDRLYITNLSSTSAQSFHKLIRGHWKIENSLHWVKDVIHGEDNNQIRKHNGPVNSAVFSSIAINLHRKNGNWSITEGQIKFGRDIPKALQTLRT
jgi:predicted transposase YbfD/YdcC